LTPKSLQEALELKAKYLNDIKILAGGTDVFVHLRNEFAHYEYLLNILNLEELNKIFEKDNNIFIGSSAKTSQIVNSPLIQEKCNILFQGAKVIGSPQIRNQSTLLGNVCNASPAGDSIPPLYVRNAIVHLKSITQERTIPIEELFVGPGQTTIQPDELVIGLDIPKKTNPVGIYLSLRQRNSLSINKVSVALEGEKVEGQIINLRIALGSVTPTVVYAEKAEAYLKEHGLNLQTINQAAILTKEAAVPINDIRSSKEYRHEMVEVLTRRGLTEILNSQ
ncbi:MAG: FAD binding domain-containing protein, partial [Candidatus Kariarchaeaceae archaeon]